MHLIHLKGIHKSFGSAEVLTGVDMQIAEGQTMVILGKSGSGKSVLLKLILRLMSADAGTIIIDDQDTTTFTEEQMIPVRKRWVCFFNPQRF